MIGHMMSRVLGNTSRQIMYFLVNASSPEPLDIGKFSGA